MPCRSDYLEPNNAETDSKLVCELIVFVLTKLGRTKEIPAWAPVGAKNIYGDTAKLNEGVVLLCSLCSKMTKKQQDSIIYDGRDATSRKLAAWWDEHQEADRIRLNKEADAKKQAALVKSAKAKLSPEEIKALKESLR